MAKPISKPRPMCKPKRYALKWEHWWSTAVTQSSLCSNWPYSPFPLTPSNLLLPPSFTSAMASSSSLLLSKLLLPLFITHSVLTTSIVEAQVEDTSLKRVRDALERPLPISIYCELNGDEEIDDDENGYSRRSLFWKRMRYYISYGALWANRIPCPPRSGRSYYTHNCFKVHGPVHPYTRGCSRITRCRRWWACLGDRKSVV